MHFQHASQEWLAYLLFGGETVSIPIRATKVSHIAQRVTLCFW
jgi:hypothetical protein